MMNSLFSSRLFAFRKGEQPERANGDRTSGNRSDRTSAERTSAEHPNGDRTHGERTSNEELRTKILNHNVMPRKILLVEEDPYYIDVIKEALSESLVAVAATWQRALLLLAHEVYDLVIISVARHAELDTLDLMRYQRYTGEEKNFLTPFIALIGEGYESRTTQALHDGCLSTIQKPFTASMLRGSIVDQFNNSPSIFHGRSS